MFNTFNSSTNILEQSFNKLWKDYINPKTQNMKSKDKKTKTRKHKVFLHKACNRQLFEPCRLGGNPDYHSHLRCHFCHTLVGTHMQTAYVKQINAYKNGKNKNIDDNDDTERSERNNTKRTTVQITRTIRITNTTTRTPFTLENKKYEVKIRLKPPHTFQ